VERKLEFKTVSLRTETTYKADALGKVAQHTEAQGSGVGVNAEVAQLQFAFLSGETPQAQAARGVSRRHSTAGVTAGRPEPDRCRSTADPQSAAKTPNGRAAELVESDGKHGETQVNLPAYAQVATAGMLGQILSRENMLLAWKRVKANKGAAGVDGMSIDAFPEFARHHWERIRSALEEGTCHPAAVLRVISRYLHAGVILPDGMREATACGVPQGGPLSPLLANIMLDDLDKELEARGHRFSRYADDFLIFVRSRSAAERVLRTVSRFIEGHLDLIINEAKSKAARLCECTFLGFRIHRGKLRWTDAAVQRFRQRVRKITNRSNGKSMRQRIPELRRYVVGWMNYYGHSRSYTQLLELDQWLRRRVRLCYWKQWKRPRTRRRHLWALGIPRDEVKLATRSRKGYWRMAANSIVQRALTKEWLWNQGVPNMRQQWVDLHYPAPLGVA
jgi:hypothetical protein